MYTIPMELEWDEAKRRETLELRGLDFAWMASFMWESAVIRSSDRAGEARWVATGYIGQRLFWAVYTERDGKMRIISLHKANARERAQYMSERSRL